MRWRGHKSELKGGYHGNSYLQASFDKYGIDAFEYSILEECPEEQRDQRELYWIRYYDTTNREHGYNRLYGGCQNKNHSDETKKKLREISIANGSRPPSQAGTIHSEEQNAYMSKIMTGRKLKPCSEEKKEKLRLANLGKIASEETRAKLSAQRIGNHYAKGAVRSEEFKTGVSAFHKGRPKSEETKAIMKLAQAKRFSK